MSLIAEVVRIEQINKRLCHRLQSQRLNTSYDPDIQKQPESIFKKIPETKKGVRR